MSELILHPGAFFHQRGQPARVGVAAHDDDGFSGPSGGVAQMRDAQVGLRRQPTVEQDLAGAGLLAAVDGAEVQEVGCNGFLRLVRLIGDEHDDTGVCFVYFEYGLTLRGHFSDLTACSMARSCVGESAGRSVGGPQSFR